MQGKAPHCHHPSHPADCNKPSDPKHCEHPDQVDILVVLKMKTEWIEKARPIAEKLIEEVRNEKGNLRYDGYQDSKEPGTFVWLESYTSMEAFHAHRESPGVQKYAQQMGEWVTDPPEVRILKPYNVVKK